MELCLGTVQFGMDYGICGQRKPSLEDAVDCLDYATQNGITAIDTANAYGVAETVVGEFLKKKKIERSKLSISSKLKPNLLDEVLPTQYYQIIRNNLEDTLSKLGTDYLDTYLFHSARYVFNDEMLVALNNIKKDGLAKKVGVSVYEPEEALAGINKTTVDFLQLPYSIFDQRMSKSNVFSEAIKNGTTEIHSRSAFIQGLILMNENNVPEFLSKARPILARIDEMCCKYNISRISLAMNFVKKEQAISHLVFGVDNINQLQENIKIFREDISDDIIDEIAQNFVDLEADIVMPSLWKR